MPRAFVSSEREMAHPSLLDSTIKGRLAGAEAAVARNIKIVTVDQGCHIGILIRKKSGDNTAVSTMGTYGQHSLLKDIFV
jgi:hypothetical protein